MLYIYQGFSGTAGFRSTAAADIRMGCCGYAERTHGDTQPDFSGNFMPSCGKINERVFGRTWE